MVGLIFRSGWVSLFALIMFAVAPLQPAYAEVSRITVTVDKNPVLVNEPFVLTVEVDDNIDRNQLNTDRLLDDFIVGRTSISHQRSIINGRATATTTFRVILTPQREGEFRIPPLSIDDAQSEPINLRVVKERQNTADNRGVAFINAAVDSDTVYVQQQFSYVAKLYLAADLNSGNITPPQLERADISQMGKDQESYEMVDGKRYRVYQREFSITPNRSGEFEIDGAVFEGEVYQSSRASMISSFASTSPVVAKAPPLKLTVKPVPADWQGAWLPSELVSFSREVSPDRDSVDVGEPLTVTYMLTAVGVKPEQLPDIEIPDFPGARAYPEQPQLDSFVRNGTAISQLTLQVAVIPSEPGSLELPAQQLAWFNTRTDQAAMINIPAQRIDVAGVAALTNDDDSTMSAETATADPSSASETQADPTQTPAESGKPEASSAPWWQYFAMALLVLWLLTLALWGYSVKKRRQASHTQSQRSHQTTADTAQQATLAKQWRALQQACKQNDATAVAQHLLRWGQIRFEPAPNTLSALAERLQSTTLADELSSLQQSLYAGPQAASWQRGATLYKALHKALQQSTQAEQPRTASLPPLYHR